MMVERKPC